MTTFYVFTCDPANQQVGTDGLGNAYPSCTTGGAWTEIDISPWYTAGVDWESFGSLLLTITTLLAMAYAINSIVRVIRGRR